VTDAWFLAPFWWRPRPHCQDRGLDLIVIVIVRHFSRQLRLTHFACISELAPIAALRGTSKIGNRISLKRRKFSYFVRILDKTGVTPVVIIFLGAHPNKQKGPGNAHRALQRNKCQEKLRAVSLNFFNKRAITL